MICFETFVLEVAKAATEANLKFIVVRNYEGLPYRNASHDIDLLVPRALFSSYMSLLRVVCDKHDLLIKPARTYYYCCQQIISNMVTGFLQVDILPCFNWRGVEWMNAEHVYLRSEHLRQGIWKPVPADECIITFCHSYLYGGIVKDRYVPLLADLANSHADAIMFHFERIFGSMLGKRILDELQMSDVASLRRHSTSRRLKVLARGFVRSPAQSSVAAVRGYLLERRITAEQVLLSEEAKRSPAERPA